VRGRRVAGGARRRAHRLRHVELRPRPGRGPGAPVRGAADPQRAPTASSSSRTSTPRRSPPTASAASP
jgi:hypothetical protein